MRFREWIVLALYRAVIHVLMPLGIVLGFPVFLFQEKRRKTLFRRLGFQRVTGLPAGTNPVWVHALSLGETLSCVSLIEELRRQLGERPLCFSVSTLAAMQIASDRIRPYVDALFYFPFDLWWPVRRAMRQVAPCVVVFIETDIWPGFQHRLRKTGTPAVLVNARLSPRTYRMCQRLRSLYSPALNTFAKILPQSEAEARRYRDVGVDPDRLGSVGNLKFDVAKRWLDPTQLEDLRCRLGLSPGDTVLVAGSTHPGEEQPVLEAFEAARRQVPAARLVIVPRHPARGEDVRSLAAHGGRKVLLYTTANHSSDWDVVVVDAMGVLSMLYHLATASFVGGSLVSKGGQNPLEPAAAGCPIVFGPDMSDFPDVASWLVEAHAAYQVNGSSELAERWVQLLDDERLRERMSDACLGVVGQHCGATSRVAADIVDLVAVGSAHPQRGS